MTVAIEDSYKPELMQDYAYFAPTRTVPMARVYVLPADPEFQPVVDKVRQHGVVVEELTAPLTTEVSSFVVEAITKVAEAVSGAQRSQAEGPVHHREGDAAGRHARRSPGAAARAARRLPARAGERRRPDQLELPGSMARGGQAGAGTQDHDERQGRDEEVGRD